MESDERQVVLSILDDGRTMELLKDEEMESRKEFCENLYIVQKVADEVKYSRIMELNHTTLIIYR